MMSCVVTERFGSFQVINSLLAKFWMINMTIIGDIANTDLLGSYNMANCIILQL